MSSAAVPTKTFRASRKPFRAQAKTVRLPAGITVRLQPGILFVFTPESFSRSPRNPFRLAPESPHVVSDYLQHSSDCLQAARYTPSQFRKHGNIETFSGSQAGPPSNGRGRSFLPVFRGFFGVFGQLTSRHSSTSVPLRPSRCKVVPQSDSPNVFP